MGQERIIGFYKKGSNNNRVVNEGAGRYNGNGKADRLYLVKGTAHAVQSVPKAGFFIESIAVFEASAAARKRAAGRDWFVRAGATGGNGTREKPYRDPFQALEKCEAGDTIHVATGEYVGKLRMGHWQIEMPDISLLGGYDKDFTARDPWKTPTLLYTPEDFKGSRNNMTVEGAEDHTGTVLDGYLNRTALVPGKVQMDDWNKYRELIGQPVIATGGTPGSGVSPAYDWKKALELFPKNPACKAGARPLQLAVKFEGVARTEETYEYAETPWDVARNATAWDKLNGQRVQFKVSVKSADNQYLLPEVKREERAVWQVGGPLGSDSGLPMRVYVLRGTRHERVFNQAKGYATGKPEELHVIKGIAKPNRQMLVEVIERAE